MAKHRKPGEWLKISVERSRKERLVRTGRGLTNIPVIGETGSAAYRRMRRTNG